MPTARQTFAAKFRGRPFLDSDDFAGEGAHAPVRAGRGGEAAAANARARPKVPSNPTAPSDASPVTLKEPRGKQI
jgi:hypothetical protein